MASILMIMLRPPSDSTPMTATSVSQRPTLTPSLLLLAVAVDAPKNKLQLTILPTKDGRSSPWPSFSIPKSACLVLTSGTATPSPLPDGTPEPPAIMASGMDQTDLLPLAPKSATVALIASLMRTPGSTGKRPFLTSGMTVTLTAKLLAPRCPSSPPSTEPLSVSLASTPSSCSSEPGDTDGESAQSTAPSSLASSSSP